MRLLWQAAGSDWVVEKICDQDGNVLNMNGKISSDIAPIIHFQKAPKVLKQIKQWDPETVLVGFKLESDLSEEELFERAKNRMKEAKANVMIANSPHSLYSRGAVHYVIGQDGKGKLCKGKDETAKEIVKSLEILCNRITAL